MGKRIHLFLLALAIGVIQGAAQVTTVRGIVTTEEDGEPVIGASVIVKGTALGTVTDVNGRFELSGLPPSATRLLISYISLMAKEVAIAPQVSVTLKSDTHLLDEVVVTALGISREKKALGYTAQEVKQDALVQGKDNNLLNSLSGKIAVCVLPIHKEMLVPVALLFVVKLLLQVRINRFLLWMESQWIIRSLMHVPADAILKMQ